jgi:hypothetical protein
MSEIPFVNRLGDAIQAAITNPRVAARHRFGPRRRLGLLAVAALLLGGGAAAARILGTPEELATSSIACQLEGSSTGIVWAGDWSPLEVCAQEYRAAGKPVPPLVACVDGRSVVVLPGRGLEACGRRGLAPLPPEYAPARAKVAKLERDILALEAATDCVAPGKLAAQVQRLLDRSGWRGWTTWPRPDVSPGPCGSVSGLGGGGDRSISGSLDYDGHRVMIFGGPPRALDDLLYGRETRLAGALMDESGQRCYTLDELRDHVRRRVEATGRSVTFEVRQREPDGELMDARQQRYQAGCAIVVGVGPAGDAGPDVVARILSKR